MMKTILLTVLTLGLCGGAAYADNYSAISSTAISVTGDIEINDAAVVFSNGARLEFSGVSSVNLNVYGEAMPASIYTVGKPADPVLENGNQLCGDGNITYIATWADGDDISLAVFTGDTAPVSNDEMCASYSYQPAD